MTRLAAACLVVSWQWAAFADDLPPEADADDTSAPAATSAAVPTELDTPAPSALAPPVAASEPGVQAASSSSSRSNATITAKTLSAFSALLRVYLDDDDVQVVTPAAQADVALGHDLTLSVETAVDIISAASVDVITQPSPNPVADTRVEGAAALTFSLSPTQRLRARALASHENDYDSWLASVGGEWEVAQRNATLSLTYTGQLDRIAQHNDPTFVDYKQVHLLSGGFTQVLDRRSYLDVVAEAAYSAGYHGNPYRAVPIQSAMTPEITWVDEALPDRRIFAAGLVRLRRALTRRWIAAASYRFYADDWSMQSHLAQIALRVQATQAWQFALTTRGYLQNAAEFYRSIFLDVGEGAPDLRSRDRTLGGMQSVFIGLEARKRRWLGSLEWLHMRFDDYAPQKSRNAFIFTIGMMTP